MSDTREIDPSVPPLPLVRVGPTVRVVEARPGVVEAVTTGIAPLEAATPPAPPPRRASLLDVRFDFASVPAPAPAPTASPAPARPTPPVASAVGETSEPATDRPDRTLLAVDRDQAEFLSPPVAEPDGAPAAVFVTETMAELYRSQGLVTQALDIYRRLSERMPHRADLRARIAELAPAPAPRPDAPVPAPHPAPEAVEPTARAYFRALGRRRAVGRARTEPSAASAGPSLTAILGAAPVEADRAARALAGAIVGEPADVAAVVGAAFAEAVATPPPAAPIARDLTAAADALAAPFASGAADDSTDWFRGPT